MPEAMQASSAARFTLAGSSVPPGGFGRIWFTDRLSHEPQAGGEADIDA
jgi:hypothetical protein